MGGTSTEITKKRKSFVRIFIRFFIFLIIVLLTAVSGYMSYKFATGELFGTDSAAVEDFTGSGIKVEIPKGAHTASIAAILKKEGLIRFEIVFRVISRLNGYDGRYKEGAHIVYNGMSYETLMKTLCKTVLKDSGKKFTVIEGSTFKQIEEVLEAKNVVSADEFKKVCQEGKFEYRFLEGLKPSKGRYNRLEGYLFPDTYIVATNAKPEEIVKKMLDRFDEKFPQEYYEKAKEFGMTIDEVITLASMIEKEAKVTEERPVVSAVFHNRLKSKKYKMLESCATIQYILGQPKEKLTIEDTKIESPYNTYINPGLPPGPICSPGEASIQAALYPSDDDYLFFVAKGDGTHIFSKTYNEHVNAKKRVESNN